MATRKARRRYAADVAVYAPFAGPLYESIPGPTGGAEVQTAYLAQALAKHGLRVVHIVFGTDLVPQRNGVRVVALPQSYGTRGLPRRLAVLASLREADAAVFIQRSAGFETGVMGLFAQVTRRRFVFSSSSKYDFLVDRHLSRQAGTSLDEWPSRMQYLIGLHLANAVVVQTTEQRVLGLQRRGVEAKVIRSFCAPGEQYRKEPGGIPLDRRFPRFQGSVGVSRACAADSGGKVLDDRWRSGAPLGRAGSSSSGDCRRDGQPPLAPAARAR